MWNAQPKPRIKSSKAVNKKIDGIGYLKLNKTVFTKNILN